MSIEETNEEDHELHNDNEDKLPPLPHLISRDDYADDDEDDNKEMITEYSVILFRQSSHNNTAPNNYQ